MLDYLRQIIKRSNLLMAQNFNTALKKFVFSKQLFVSLLRPSRAAAAAAKPLSLVSVITQTPVLVSADGLPSKFLRKRTCSH